MCFGAVSSAPSYRPVKSPDSEMVNAPLSVEIVAPATVVVVSTVFPYHGRQDGEFRGMLSLDILFFRVSW